jgi:hypothetical protein
MIYRNYFACNTIDEDKCKTNQHSNKLEKNKPGRGEQTLWKVKSVEHSMFGGICIA